MNNRTQSFSSRCWLCAILLLSAQNLPAQTWDGGGFSDSFGDFLNWNPNSAPANNGSADVVFAGSTRLTPLVDTLWSLRSIAFGFNAGAFNISGNPIQLGPGGISNFSSTQQTLNIPLIFAAPQIWNAGDSPMVFSGSIDNLGQPLTIAASSTIAITGQITGTGSLRKEGSGMLGFGGASANTYSGTTTVNAGTLVLSKPAGDASNNFGSAMAGPLIINSGALVRLGGNHQIRDFGAALTIGGTLDLNGFTESVGAVTLNGGSVTTGSGSLGFWQNLTSNASAVEASISGNLTALGSSRRLTVEDGAAAIDLNIPAVISGINGIEKWGEGTLRLSGNNTFTGGFNLVTGTIAVASHTALGTGTFQTSNAFPTIRPDGGPREIPNRFDIFGAFTVAGPNPLTFSGPATLNTFFINMAIENSTTFSGPISGNSSGDEFKKSGSGTLVFRGAEANTHNLHLALNAGTVLLTKNAGVAALPRNVIVGDGVGGALADVLRWGNSNQLNPLFSTRVTTINSSGLVDMAGFSDNLGNLTMTGGTLRAGLVTVIGDIKTNAHTASAIISDGAVSSTPGARLLDVADGAASIDLEVSSGLSSAAGGSLTKKGAGTVGLFGPVSLGGGFTLDEGTVDASAAAGMSTSTFSQNGGAYIGNLTARDSFTFNGGTFSGRLTNQGAATFNANLSLAGLNNSGSFTLNPSPTLSVGAFGIDNQGVITMAGGALTASGPIVNSGLITGFGTIGGAGGFTNNSLLRQTGTLVLSNTGLNENFGNIDLAAGQQLQLNGASLTNAGSLNLNDALISGSGMLTNTLGGVISGRGIINSTFANSGGVIVVESGTTRISAAFTNNGTIQLNGASASMTGGSIENTGNIQGFGSAGNDIGNNGTIAASGGNLVLAGRVRNFEKGLLSAAAGSQLTIARGLGSNEGIINLLGGVFENSGSELDNAGQISGFGTIRTGTLINHGSITFTGGLTTINGNVINEPDRQLRVAYNPALFTGNVTNNGIFKNTETTITFAATYTENGTYISDPADNFFNDVSIGAAGAWVGGYGDRFIVSGDLLSSSSAKAAWQTTQAELRFSGGIEHILSVMGEDRGIDFAGYEDNFAWRALSLGAGDSLVLDDVGDLGGALYVRELHLAGGLAQINNITGNGLNIYYHLGDPANAYLGGKTYALSGGGSIAPVPEPGITIFGLITALSLLARRRPRDLVGGTRI